ncbi:helix-turn-helix transcriptional regulator [Photobacterium sp. BZF1]|uniref:helix-turn-helix domain-containing protein n=1 Tax=Photobacterium sp. BZF1 TaxID=1904457 RepID=UPI0016536155|nr:AraC family transcriptional regulator [Photobacterium sp. BZF1]MBC7001472.1 helix-turn-helix transcriptional regulator [Photobacterium sp. BZF1]
MSSLPVCRAALSAPFLTFLDENDRDPSPLLKRLRIDRKTLENPTLYLPSHVVSLIVDSASKTTGHDDIGFYAAQCVGKQALHPETQQQLANSLGVSDFLDTLISFQHLQGSHFRLWFECHNGKFKICHQSSLKATDKSYQHANEFTTFLIIKLLKEHLGDSWQPNYLAFDHQSSPKAKIVGQTAEKKVFYGADYSYVPVSLNVEDLQPFRRQPNQRHCCSMARVKGVVDTFWQEEHFGIDFVAHLFGVSERTLQRLFIQHNSSFRDYLNQKKIEKSMVLLQQGHSVQAVAEKLNYSDPSNFSRAMKKHLKQTPTQYLKSLSLSS